MPEQELSRELQDFLFQRIRSVLQLELLLLLRSSSPRAWTAAEIARELCYSQRTVKNILHDVTTRLQLRNRSHAVAYAVREGLI